MSSSYRLGVIEDLINIFPEISCFFGEIVPYSYYGIVLQLLKYVHRLPHQKVSIWESFYPQFVALNTKKRQTRQEFLFSPILILA